MLLDQACRSATNFAPSMRMAAEDPNGAKACSASVTSSFSRALAAGTPSTLTRVALPAAASLPVCLPTSAGSPSRSSRSSAIWNAWPTAAAVTLQRRALRGRRCGQNAAGLAGEAQQRAGLHRLQCAHVFFAELKRGAVLHEAALGGEIEHLAAGHAADARRARQRHDQLDAHARVGVGLWPRQNIEGESEQAVAGQDRGRLVERLVRGRLAAP